MSFRYGHVPIQPTTATRLRDPSFPDRTATTAGRELGEGPLRSPVHRLPAEVLGEVLLLAVSRDNSYLLEYSSPRDELTALQLVCRSWRHVALLTHHLWPILAISEDQLRLDKIETWFNRAGDLPKKLIFTLRCTLQHFESSLAAPTLARLLTRGPQLHHFCFHAPSPKCFRTLMHFVQTSKPRRSPRRWDAIQALSLSFTQRWSGQPSQRLCDGIPSTVTSFQLRCPDLPEGAINLSPTTTFLQRLTSIALRCTQIPSPLLGILKLCDNLEVLTLDLGHKDTVRIRDTEIELAANFGLLLPKVRTLNLETVTRCGVHFLRYLKTPRLENLKIKFHLYQCGLGWNNPPPLEYAIIPFVTRQSKCEATLRRLHLDGLNLNGCSEQVGDVLLALPHLTHLTLGYVSSVRREPQGFFSTLLNKASLQRVLCLPQLEVLELLNYPLGDFEDLCQFLEMRRPDRSASERGASSQAPPDRSQRYSDALRGLTLRYYYHRQTHCDSESFEIVNVLRRSGVLVDIGHFCDS